MSRISQDKRIATCDYCRKVIEISKSNKSNNKNHFCSKDCRYKFISENSGIEKICEICGKKFKVMPSRENIANTCSLKCRGKRHSKKIEGTKHPQWQDTYVTCDYCGKLFKQEPQFVRKNKNHFCSNKCNGLWLSKYKAGDNSYNWKGGKETDYGNDWQYIKKKVLKRDRYICAICKKGKKDFGENPTVHHIILIKEFEKPEDSNYMDNLICLCRKHHMMIHKVVETYG